MGAASAVAAGLWKRPAIRQFVKFCIVGVGSTLINLGTIFLLIEIVHLDRLLGTDLSYARPPAQLAGFILSVTNGFFFNMRWTFQSGDPVAWRDRYPRFIATNSVGLLLNMAVANLVALAIPDTAARLLSPPLRDPRGLIGSVTATAVVVFWNFAASKYWTFRQE